MVNLLVAGVDFDEPFASTARMSPIWIYPALVGEYRWHVGTHTDGCKMSFPHVRSKQEVYVEEPPWLHYC
eukprot:c31482_g1_i1 orf=54-263(+)